MARGGATGEGRWEALAWGPDTSGGLCYSFHRLSVIHPFRLATCQSVLGLTGQRVEVFCFLCFSLIFPVVSHSLVSGARKKEFTAFEPLGAGLGTCQLELESVQSAHSAWCGSGWRPREGLFSRPSTRPWLSPTAVHIATLSLGIVESFCPRSHCGPGTSQCIKLWEHFLVPLLSHEKTTLSWDLTHFACILYTHTK